MGKYLIVIEKAGNNFSAFSPDVPGCAATGSSIEIAVENMKAAIQFHFEDLADIPLPKGISRHISDGVFNQDNIAEEYFITETVIAIPHFA